MTDNELLRLCLEAFKAEDTAAHANNFLKKQKEKRQLYRGTGQVKLRAYMIKRLEQHLGMGEFSA